MGIEPTRPAWKAGVLPLNYTRILPDQAFWWSFKLTAQSTIFIIPLQEPFVKHFFIFFSSKFNFVQLYLFVLLMLFHFIHYNIFKQKANDTCYESYSKHHKCNCKVTAFYIAPQNR